MSRWFQQMMTRILVALGRLLQDDTHPDVVETTTPSTTTDTPPTPTPTPTPTTANGDAIDILGLSIGVKNCPGVTSGKVRNAKITVKFKSAWTDGKHLHTEYEPYSWPAKGKEKQVDAIVFWGYGARIEKFDYWAAGGQKSKTMANLTEGTGYDTLQLPSKGTKCYTMICSLDGEQRSNIVEVTWK